MNFNYAAYLIISLKKTEFLLVKWYLRVIHRAKTNSFASAMRYYGLKYSNMLFNVDRQFSGYVIVEQ